MPKQEKNKVDKESKKEPKENKTSKKRKSNGLISGRDNTPDFTEAELDFLEEMGFM